MNKHQKNIMESSGLKISLDYVTIGEGSPKTFILSGIHGDERSGQLIIKELLANLPDFKGTLTVLPVANPLAYAMSQRDEPLSGQDLNRSFTGKNDGRPLFKLANAIAELAKEHDYIIDLHGYQTAGLLQVGVTQGDESLKMAEMLLPDVVRVAHAAQEYKINGALSSVVRKEGKSYLLIELPSHEYITEEQVKRVSGGIAKHLTNCNNYSSIKPDQTLSKPFIRIKLVKSEQAGVFERESSLNLGDSVRQGEKLGILTVLPSQEIVEISCPYDGIICEMNEMNQSAVIAGETLVGIGELLADEEKEQLLNGTS